MIVPKMKKKHLICENKGFAEERALAERLALRNGKNGMDWVPGQPMVLPSNYVQPAQHRSLPEGSEVLADWETSFLLEQKKRIMCFRFD